MKVYIMDNRLIFVGKAWEIRAKLREYQQKYDSVSNWIQSHATNSPTAKKS
jgi:hypothetical protein